MLLDKWHLLPPHGSVQLHVLYATHFPWREQTEVDVDDVPKQVYLSQYWFVWPVLHSHLSCATHFPNPEQTPGVPCKIPLHL